VLVRALAQVAIEMAVRTCAPLRRGRGGSAARAPKEAAEEQEEQEEEAEDRRRILTWLELVAMMMGAALGTKVCPAPSPLSLTLPFAPSPPASFAFVLHVSSHLLNPS
jgi:hypothetical protein